MESTDEEATSTTDCSLPLREIAVSNKTRRELLEILGIQTSEGIGREILSLPANAFSQHLFEDVFDQMAEIIQDMCRSQVRLWQQVPALVLEAEGRGGFAPQAVASYRYHLWTLIHWQLYVDLDTGEIVTTHPASNTKRRATTREVIENVAFHIHLIDASAVLAQLVAKIKSTPNMDSKLTGHPMDIEQWRSDNRTRYNLGKPSV